MIQESIRREVDGSAKDLRVITGPDS